MTATDEARRRTTAPPRHLLDKHVEAWGRIYRIFDPGTQVRGPGPLPAAVSNRAGS